MQKKKSINLPICLNNPEITKFLRNSIVSDCPKSLKNFPKSASLQILFKVLANQKTSINHAVDVAHGLFGYWCLYFSLNVVFIGLFLCFQSQTRILYIMPKVCFVVFMFSCWTRRTCLSVCGARLYSQSV